MGRYYEAANAAEDGPEEGNKDIVLYCNQFEDVIPDRVCVLRRHIFSGRSGSTCKSCIMNIALERSAC